MRTPACATTYTPPLKRSSPPTACGHPGSIILGQAPSNELSSLSPIVKSSVRRSSGRIRMLTLRYSSKPGGARSTPAKLASSKSTLPREILDRSLPAIPDSPQCSSSFAIKRKAVPQYPHATPKSTPSPAHTSDTRSTLSSRTPSQADLSARTVCVIPPCGSSHQIDPIMSGRTRYFGGIRVKEAVEKIENSHLPLANDVLCTPVKGMFTARVGLKEAIGRIIDRPISVSSAGLSTEGRRLMAEARLKRQR